MKKKIFTLIALSALLTACGNIEQNKNPKFVAPNGTPLIALSNYAINHMDDLEVVSGGQPLVAEFVAEEADMIAAPINLGAMRYNAKPVYGLYKTLVWDNIYILSKEELTSIEDLDGKNITSFGQGSTPQIVLETILKSKSVTCEIDYVDNVQIANSMFTSGESDIVISAQPQVSAINTTTAHVLSLNTFWKDVTGLDTYPQAGLFVKISELDKLQDALKEVDASYASLTTDISKTAENAETVTGTFKKALLEKAIPNCGFKSVKNEVDLVKAYYEAMINLGMAAQVGGKIPDEAFFLNK
ncbi:MAG: ABC transporter substrate-binding protein [Erysipelotrichales bacterium]|nr:ABC transporter substrate-binding protein [Erysipelotrichales bacterium]